MIELVVILGIAAFGFMVLSIFLVLDVQNLQLELELERETARHTELLLQVNGIDIDELEQYHG